MYYARRGSSPSAAVEEVAPAVVVVVGIVPEGPHCIAEPSTAA